MNQIHCKMLLLFRRKKSIKKEIRSQWKTTIKAANSNRTAVKRGEKEEGGGGGDGVTIVGEWLKMPTGQQRRLMQWPNSSWNCPSHAPKHPYHHTKLPNCNKFIASVDTHSYFSFVYAHSHNPPFYLGIGILLLFSHSLGYPDLRTLNPRMNAHTCMCILVVELDEKHQKNNEFCPTTKRYSISHFSMKYGVYKISIFAFSIQHTHFHAHTRKWASECVCERRKKNHNRNHNL